ncbi:hypothetical protein SAMN05421737_103278 [Shouchella lonarensis]|uniref:Uncharacterized protein n=1 Tax=Shouchella lonarensis TaxID=1464122 RepID=A0A1G6HGG9_9BACI|nr:hypothetical protein SAMN05421737_103278 [Shouchella lonarensis]
MPFTEATPPVGPVGPVGPRNDGMAVVAFIFDSNIISFLKIVSSMSATLSFTSKISCNVAVGPVMPSKVPKTYWIFSPSALMMCAKPISSIAMDANNRLTTSSRLKLISGVKFGMFACDICIPPFF